MSPRSQSDSPQRRKIKFDIPEVTSVHTPKKSFMPEENQQVPSPKLSSFYSQTEVSTFDFCRTLVLI